jgi:outer membrane immunogenic protein
MKGALAGGQLGFNYQINQFVFGVEGDGSWTDIHQHSVTSIFPPNTTTNDGRVEWVASIRGRVGVAFDSLLIYGTGGAAWASLKLSEQTLFNPGAIVARNLADSSGIVHDGWVAGGGIEWMFAPNWMARAEYLHYEFDSKLHFNPNPLFGIPTDLKMDVARAGVSYKFGWAASPVAAKY